MTIRPPKRGSGTKRPAVNLAATSETRGIGNDIRRLREELGWSRGDLAPLADLTVAQVARIETTGRCNAKELTGLREALGLIDEDEPDEPWRALSHGDAVFIDGEAKSRFMFIQLIERDGKEPLVEVIGGKPGRRLTRTFTADRVIMGRV